MPHIPEGFDPNVAHIVDAGGNVFQELAPIQTIEVVVGEQLTGETEGGVPIMEPIVETVELPREWDEAKTVEAVEAAEG